MSGNGQGGRHDTFARSQLYPHCKEGCDDLNVDDDTNGGTYDGNNGDTGRDSAISSIADDTSANSCSTSDTCTNSDTVSGSNVDTGTDGNTDGSADETGTDGGGTNNTGTDGDTGGDGADDVESRS